MKKRTKVLLAVVCVCILAVAVFKPQLLALADGERILVFIPLSGPVPGSSAYSDLYEDLAVYYGEEGVAVESRLSGEDNATVYDTSEYEFQYLGRGIRGGNYILCTVNTVQTVVFEDEEKIVPDTARVCTCIGYDDAILNSRARAKILWETLKEEYPDGEAQFYLTDLEGEHKF